MENLCTFLLFAVNLKLLFKNWSRLGDVTMSFKKKKKASFFHSPDISNFKPHTKGNCKAFVTARWEEKALEELGYRLTLQEKL